MSRNPLNEQDCQIRLHIFNYLVEHGRAPTCAETARRFNISPETARLAYHRLHDHHRIFLDPGTDNVRMAHPLSAIPTAYRVIVKERALWANCAWDSLGIPAMLRADAQIEATNPVTGVVESCAVENGQLKAEDGIVHISLPFRQWYDDLIHT